MTKEQREEKTPEQLAAEVAQLKSRVAELEAAQIGHKKGLGYFNERLDEEVARSRRYKYEFSIMLIEVDNLTSYSRKAGEGSEAEILSMFEAALNDTMRKTDLRCRWEKSKCGMILPYTGAEGAAVAAEKVRQALERVFSLQSAAVHTKLTASIGIASYPRDSMTFEQLMSRGLQSLSVAQAAGGNCVRSPVQSKGTEVVGTGGRARALLSDTVLLAVDEEVQRCARYGQEFSLIVFQVTLPDGVGSQVAEIVKAGIMRAAHKILDAATRVVDRSYIYSDNRFAVILPQTGPGAAEMVALKIMRSLTGNPVVRNEEKDIILAVNAGIATFPGDDASREGLIHHAEDALVRAVSSGPNRVQLSSEVKRTRGDSGRNIVELITELRESGPGAVYGLLAAVDVIEHYEQPHSHAVAKYAMAIASSLGLSNAAVRRVRIIALLHDLGKACLPDSLITKPVALNDEEWEMMRKHPKQCSDILQQFPEFSYCSQPILAHHERPDGKGYPMGLKGEQIPLESRIIAVAEAYDDMTGLRPYRKQFLPVEAVEELKRQSGTQFDPAVVKAMANSLHRTEMGSWTKR